MSKETEKFVKDFNATRKQLKEYSLAEAQKRKKRVTDWLETTWKFEDSVSEGVQKARMAGNTGSKAADFVNEPGVTKPLKDWYNAVQKHHKNVDTFHAFRDDVIKLQTELQKRTTAVEKELKKSKTGAGDIKVMATVKEAKAALADLKKTSGVGGSLPAHVTFYARKLQASVDAIVRDALKKVDPKEFPKPLLEANRKRTDRTIARHEKKFDALSKSTRSLIGDGDEKKLNKALSMTKTEMDAVNKFADEFETVKKKMRKELKDAKDGKEISILIERTLKIRKSMTKEFDDLQDDVADALD